MTTPNGLHQPTGPELQRSGFLQGILDDPDDDDLRLIYADWLDDHSGDDTLSAYIRARVEHERQCDPTAGMPRDDSDTCVPAAVLEVCNRLRGRWGKRGGLVEHVAPQDAALFLERWEAIYAVAPVRSLGLTWTKNVGMLAGSPALSPIRELTLGCVDATPRQDLIAILRSPHLSQLQKLNLKGVSDAPALSTLLTEAWDDAHPHPRHLREIFLFGWNETDETLESLWSHPLMAGLETVDITPFSTACTSRSLATLAACPSARSLRTLKLFASHAIDNDALRALIDSPHLTSLEHLCLANCSIDSAGIALLADSALLGQLRSLDVSGTDVWSDGIRAIAESTQPTHLRSLAFRMDVHGDPALESIAASASLTQLDALIMNNCGLTDGGLEALANAPKVAHLRSLDLGDNGGVTDDGIRALCASPHGLHLRSLQLCNTSVTVAGITALLRSPAMAQLERLHVGNDGMWHVQPHELQELRDALLVHPRLRWFEASLSAPGDITLCGYTLGRRLYTAQVPAVRETTHASSQEVLQSPEQKD